jgi:hypothetical protein
MNKPEDSGDTRSSKNGSPAAAEPVNVDDDLKLTPEEEAVST